MESFVQMRDTVYARAEKIMEVLTKFGIQPSRDEIEPRDEDMVCRCWLAEWGTLTLEVATDINYEEGTGIPLPGLSIILEDEFTGDCAGLYYDVEDDDWSWSMEASFRGRDIREPFRSFRPSEPADSVTNEEALQCLSALASRAFSSPDILDI